MLSLWFLWPLVWLSDVEHGYVAHPTRILLVVCLVLHARYFTRTMAFWTHPTAGLLCYAALMAAMVNMWLMTLARSVVDTSEEARYVALAVSLLVMPAMTICCGVDKRMRRPTDRE